MGSLTQSEIFQIIFGLVGSIMSALLLGNLFFLKKLVHKVDLIDSLVANIGILAKQLDSLCGKVEMLSDVRIEIAALKARFLHSMRTRHGGNGEIIEDELPT